MLDEAILSIAASKTALFEHIKTGGDKAHAFAVYKR